MACKDDNQTTVELLLSRGANIDLPDGGGNTPLFIAYLYDNKEVSKLLLEHGANPTTTPSINLGKLVDKAIDISGTDLKDLEVEKIKALTSFNARECYEIGTIFADLKNLKLNEIKILTSLDACICYNSSFKVNDLKGLNVEQISDLANGKIILEQIKKENLIKETQKIASGILKYDKGGVMESAVKKLEYSNSKNNISGRTN